MGIVARWSSNAVNILLPVFTIGSMESCTKPYQFVQMRFRKPRHLPRAPSKDRSYFKKHHPTQKDQQENLFLYQNYNSLLKSLVAVFQEEIVLKDMGVVHTSDENTWDEDAHHKKCMLYNNAENERLLDIRMSRIGDKRVAMKEEALRKKEKIETRQKEKRERYQREVMDTIESSHNWITLENFGEKIEEAVDNPVNYNFCVDWKGVIVKRTAQVLTSRRTISDGKTKVVAKAS